MRNNKGQFQIKDLAGQRFGKLVVVEATEQRKNRYVLFRCQCDCGKECLVRSVGLSQGGTKSCGCSQRELAATLMRKITHLSLPAVMAAVVTHGHCKDGSHSPTYSSWSNMISRTTNPNTPKYAYYGGAGVTVCDRWLTSFEAFLADMGERPAGTMLGRLLDSGNYEPGNAFWQTWAEQGLNQRNKSALTKWALAA